MWTYNQYIHMSFWQRDWATTSLLQDLCTRDMKLDTKLLSISGWSIVVVQYKYMTQPTNCFCLPNLESYCKYWKSYVSKLSLFSNKIITCTGNLKWYSSGDRKWMNLYHLINVTWSSLRGNFCMPVDELISKVTIFNSLLSISHEKKIKKE